MQEKLNWYVVFSVPSVTEFYLNPKPHYVFYSIETICLHVGDGSVSKVNGTQA